MTQSPSMYEVGEFYVAPISRAWVLTGNTDTVTDESITSGTMVLIMNTTAYAGRWYVSNITPTSTSVVNGNNVITPGTFTVTSSSSETQTTTLYKYQLA